MAEQRSRALVALLAATLAGLAAGAILPRRTAPVAVPGRNRLLLLETNALHTDIGLPATKLVRERLRFLKDVGLPIDDPNLTHILVGWGGEGFYPNNARPYRIGPLTLVESVIGDESVLRFAALAEPRGAFRGKHVFAISDESLGAILAFVEETLERDAAGRFKPLDHPGIIELDHFFQARPTFAAFAGCNVWVAKALAAAGIASGRWTPIPQTLFASLAIRGVRGTPESDL